MTEYTKKTVADLQEILKSHSLPHTGKKAELIARLQEFDKTKEFTTEAPKPSSAGAEDEIDWDDDGGVAAKPSTDAGAALIAAGGKGPVATPQAVPNQQAAVDPSTTNDLTVSKPAETAAATTEKENEAAKTVAEKKEEAPTKDFSQGMKATDVDEELEKRKKRAAKFGTTLDAGATDEKEAAQKAERAKRFGVSDESGSGEAVKGLDEALPERTRKRGRMEEDGGRGGKRRDFGGRGRGNRSRGGGGDGGGRRENGSGGAPKATNYSEKDRLAAEARKKRFATTA